MKKIISCIIAFVLMFSFSVTAFAAENVETSETFNEPSRTTYIMNESGHISSAGSLHTYSTISNNVFFKSVTVIVNFYSPYGGSAKLHLGDFFEKDIPCDGASHSYSAYITALYSSIPVMWDIENHPSAFSYSFSVYY